MTYKELYDILDKTFHVDSNGFVHYQSAKAWLHYGQLVAEAEREACAKICDSYGMPDGTSETARILAKAIRGQK